MLKYFKDFKDYAFRLELLQKYDVKEEESVFKKFLKTGEFQKSCLDDWIQIIKDAKKRDAKMQRVHVVEFPLSDYIKFELEGYKYTHRAGEEIRLISKDKYTKLKFNQSFDFWLFDDNKVLKMNYSKGGKFLGFELIEEGIAEYVRVKDKLLRNSITLGNFNY